MQHLAARPLPALHVNHSSRGISRLQAFAFPSGLRIVNSPVEPLREKSDRIRHAQHHPLSIHQRHQRILAVARSDRRVLTQTESVELIHPVVVTGFGAARIRDAFQLRRRERIQRPSFRTMLPRRIRSIEGSLAFAPVETGEVSAGRNGPHHAVGIDIETTRRKSLNRRLRIVPRQFINFRQRGSRWIRAGIQAYDASRKAEDRTPDGAIGRAHGNDVKRAPSHQTSGYACWPGCPKWIPRPSTAKPSSAPEEQQSWDRAPASSRASPYDAPDREPEYYPCSIPARRTAGRWRSQ